LKKISKPTHKSKKPAPKKNAKPMKMARPPKTKRPPENIPAKKPPVLVPPRKPMELLPPPKPESLLTYEKPKVEFPEIQPIPLPKEPRVQPLKQPEPPEIRPEPVQEEKTLQQIEPALDLLPVWEDRLRLKRIIFEDALAFISPSPESPDFTASRDLLAKTGKRGFRDVPNYFLVCIKDKSGAVIGAMDGHFTNDILVILRSGVSGQKKRELHILLYSAAMSGRNPKYIIFAAERKPLDFSHAGELILFGRGFGMSAFVAEKLLFVRRMKKELDPLSNGPEVSKILDSMVPFVPELGKIVLEFSAKGIVAFAPLPTSPDSREHLHELKDAAESLGLVPPDIDQLIEDLKHRYVYGREDITPELL
jgi:hypothetical protein